MSCVLIEFFDYDLTLGGVTSNDNPFGFIMLKIVEVNKFKIFIVK